MPFIIRFFALLAIKMAVSLALSKGSKATDDFTEKVAAMPFMVIVVGPIFEELVFRYIPIWYGATDTFGWLMLSSSVLFAAAHIPNFKQGAPQQFLRCLFAACVYAWVALNWGIEYAILMHMLNNAIAYFGVISQMKNTVITWQMRKSE